MNTVLFSTDVAAPAFQHNQYIQYKLWVALCFVKIEHEHTSKVIETTCIDVEGGTAFNIVSFRKRFCSEMRRCIRRWETKVDTVYSSNTTWYLWPRFLKLRQCSTTAPLSMTLPFYVSTNVCIEKYWFRFTMTRTCSHISFLFASHSVVSRCKSIFLENW